MTVRVGITGAAGRMGRMLAQAIADSDTPSRLTAAIERPESTLLGADMGELQDGEASGVVISSDLSAVADQIDVLIDFTVPESTLAQAAICAVQAVSALNTCKLPTCICPTPTRRPSSGW